MNFPVFHAFLLCFVSVTLRSSVSAEQTDIQQLNKFLLQSGSTSQYENYLIPAAVTAASAGKNVFHMPEGLSEDCVRTARAATDLLATPSAWNAAKSVLNASAVNTINEIKSGKNSTNPMELLCQKMNEEFGKIQGTYFQNFEELKKNTDVPTPAKNYYFEIQPDQLSTNSLRQATNKHIDDPEILKYVAPSQFQSYEYRRLKPFVELVGISKTIHQLSEHETYRTTVDRAFRQALEDYIKETRTKYAGSFENMLLDAMSPTFTKKVDEYFRKNAVLNEEYEKMKKEAVDEANLNAKI